MVTRGDGETRRAGVEATSRHDVGATRRIEEAAPISSLVPVVGRTHRTLALALLRDVGLSPGQELLLMQLWDHEPQSQAELAEHMCIEPPTATKMLGRMEATGLITRARSTTDRRVTLVSLTDQGRALREPVREIWSDLEQIAVTGLTRDEQDTLLSLLRRVVANVAASLEEHRRPS